MDNEKTGLLVEPKNEKAIAQAIITLAKDPRKRKLLGNNGYQKMKKIYTIEKSFSQVHEVLYEATLMSFVMTQC